MELKRISEFDGLPPVQPLMFDHHYLRSISHQDTPTLDSEHAWVTTSSVLYISRAGQNVYFTLSVDILYPCHAEIDGYKQL